MWKKIFVRFIFFYKTGHYIKIDEISCAYSIHLLILTGMSMLRKLPVKTSSGQPADSYDGRKTTTDSYNVDGRKTATDNCADDTGDRPGRVVIRIVYSMFYLALAI